MTSRHIDLHCHFVPPALLERIQTEGARHSIHLRDDGTVSFAGRDATLPMPEGMLDLDERSRWMDDQGIDVQILSAWMDFSAYVLDPEDGAWLARALNELTHEAIAEQKKASKQASKGQPKGTAFGPLPGATGAAGASP